jgi:hypothetical protein
MQENTLYTYIMPAPAGAKAFDKDIAVVAIPFAAPLCSCGYE